MPRLVPFVKELYPVNWLTTIRPLALKRAGYKCEICKIHDRSMGYRDEQSNFVECDSFMLNWAIVNKKKVFKVILTVSHSNHDTTDNRKENLMALCQRCHLQHDKELHSLSRKSKKQTEFPAPYSSIPL